MLRKLRVLAAFFMVPVVLFVNPPQATAAMTYSDWTAVTLSADVSYLGDSAPAQGTCKFNVRAHDTGTARFFDVGNSGYCVGLPDVTPGALQPSEAGSGYRISATGEGCSTSVTGIFGPHPLNGTLRVAGSIGSAQAPITQDCVITQVCIDVSDFPGADPACDTVEALDPGTPVEQPQGACPYGTPSVSMVEVVLYSEGSSSYRWILQYTFTFANELPPGRKWTMTNYNLRTGVWRAYPGILDRFAGTVTMQVGENLQYSKTEPKPPVSAFGAQGVQFSTPMFFDSAGNHVSTLPAGGTTWNSMANGTAADTWAAGFAGPAGSGTGKNIPPSFNHYYGGWTDPSHCRFWVGPKVLNVDGYENDEPSSDVAVPPPPVDEPEPEEPPVEEPDPIVDPFEAPDFSWLWGILDAIKRALVSLGNAIAGLASAIVNGIKDALNDVFLPSDGYMEAKWDGVENKWAGTSPGLYLDSLAGLNSGSVSGCSGVPLNVDLGGGVTINESIGGACDGPMATAASITRAVVTAMFAIGGAVACVRAVGAGLGWSPGIGRGAVA